LDHYINTGCTRRHYSSEVMFKFLRPPPAKPIAAIARICTGVHYIGDDYADLSTYTLERRASAGPKPRLPKYKILASDKWINLPLKLNKKIAGWLNDAKYAQNVRKTHTSARCTHPKFRLDEYTHEMFWWKNEQLMYVVEIDATGTVVRECITGIVTESSFELCSSETRQ